MREKVLPLLSLIAPDKLLLNNIVIAVVIPYGWLFPMLLPLLQWNFYFWFSVLWRAVQSAWSGWQWTGNSRSEAEGLLLSLHVHFSPKRLVLPALAQPSSKSWQCWSTKKLSQADSWSGNNSFNNKKCVIYPMESIKLDPPLCLCYMCKEVPIITQVYTGTSWFLYIYVREN